MLKREEVKEIWASICSRHQERDLNCAVCDKGYLVTQPHVTDLFSLEELQDALDKKLVKKEKHPELSLWIYNYTAHAQYEWDWNEVTLNCRGLILDEDGFIIARPFRKFFTMEQLAFDEKGKKILDWASEQPFKVLEKMDGSMLVVTTYENSLIVATRGSFISEQALRAKKIIEEKYSDFTFHRWWTYLFEVIYPENRVVVDYKGMEDIVLLGVLNNQNGIDVSRREGYKIEHNFKVPKEYTFNSLDEIKAYEEVNAEGFVLLYPNDLRIKVKLEEYKRLHRLITGLSEKTIWEALSTGEFDKLLEATPDEAYSFVEEVKESLEFKFRDLERQACEIFSSLMILNYNRKDFAIALNKSGFKYPSLVFNMLDEKDYSQAIWKIIRPDTTRVFKIISEESN